MNSVAVSERHAMLRGTSSASSAAVICRADDADLSSLGGALPASRGDAQRARDAAAMLQSNAAQGRASVSSLGGTGDVVAEQAAGVLRAREKPAAERVECAWRSLAECSPRAAGAYPKACDRGKDCPYAHGEAEKGKNIDAKL